MLPAAFKEAEEKRLFDVFSNYAKPEKIDCVIIIDGKAFAYTTETGARKIEWAYRYSNPNDVRVGQNAQKEWYFIIKVPGGMV